MRTDDIQAFIGMGSKPAKERVLAEHRRLLAGREATGPESPDRERDIVRAAAQGDLERATDRLAARATADLEQEARRLAANAPAVEAELKAMRQAKRERDLRHRRLAAQQPQDRISGERVVTTTPGAGPWERLAARAHAEASRVTVGEGPLPQHYDPDNDDYLPDVSLLAKFGR